VLVVLWLVLQANRVSCVGVISHAHGGGLTASLSSLDLRGLLPDHFVGLAAPVLQFLTAKASAGWAWQQQKPAAAAAAALPAQQQSPQQSPRQELNEQQQQQQQVLGPAAAPQPRLRSATSWGLKVNDGALGGSSSNTVPLASMRQLWLQRQASDCSQQTAANPAC